MSHYLNTLGRTTLGIGICARCSRKMSLDELYDDPNAPGLKVCRLDLDQLDPYRLPARQTETVTLPFTRPDTPIGTNPAGFITEDGDDFLITEDDEYLMP